MAREFRKICLRDEWIPSACGQCYNSCGLMGHVVDGVLVKLEGQKENPQNLGKLCAKGHAQIMALYNPWRVKVPLKRTNPEKGIGVDPRWMEITWEEALQIITEKLKKIRENDPRKLVISSFDQQSSGILYSAFGAAFGTSNYWYGGAAYFCGNGYHPITYATHGTFFGEPDIERSKYLILFGTQHGFVSNHLPMDNSLKMADALARGMYLAVVDPICTNAASKASEWVPIRPGTDAALALGMVNVLLNELGIYDANFIRKFTNGPYVVGPDQYYVRDEKLRPLVWDLSDKRAKPYDSEDLSDLAIEGEFTVGDVKCRPAFSVLKEHVKKYTPEFVEEITTVPAETVRRLAKGLGGAASIGSTTTIDGVELPYRPACVYWYRGSIAHKHGMLSGWSIQLLNIILGSIDVPGGHLGVNGVGPHWEPQIGPDGLLVPPHSVGWWKDYCVPRIMGGAGGGYDRAGKVDTSVRPPESMDLNELFPLAPYSTPLFAENLLHPEKYKVPYKPEAMINCRSNLMTGCANPSVMAEAIKKIPFIVCFAVEMNETAELADIVLPDAHYLERLDAFPNEVREWVGGGPGFWYWMFRNPMVKPPFEARHWVEVLFEIADRIGIRKDLYVMVNSVLDLTDEYKLDPNGKYTWEEIADRWAKSRCGEEHGVEWFRMNGFYIMRKKTLKEAYPRIFIKPRIPVYLEHYIRAGVQVKQAVKQLGLTDWDTSDYQPLPDWKPCRAHETKEPHYDLFPVNYKLQFHTFSHTTNNPWLDELARAQPYAYGILINSETARRKGVKEGQTITLEAVETGYKVQGKAVLSELLHPETLGIAGTFGHWAKNMPVARGKGIHWNTLLPHDLGQIDMLSTALDQCVKVKVYPSDPTPSQETAPELIASSTR